MVLQRGSKPKTTTKEERKKYVKGTTDKSTESKLNTLPHFKTKIKL